MKKALLVFAGIAGFTAMTGFAMHHHYGDPTKMITAQVEDLLDDVHATDAQRQQILAIEQKLLADGKALHQAQAGAHQELLAQWNAAQPDAAKVNALIDARIDALRAFAHEAADGVIQAHAILTPDQRAQIGRKLERHAEAHGMQPAQ